MFPFLSPCHSTDTESCQVFPFLSPCHSTDIESCKCSLSSVHVTLQTQSHASVPFPQSMSLYRHRVLQVFPFLSPCHSTDTESCKCSLSSVHVTLQTQSPASVPFPQSMSLYRHRVLQVFPFLSPCHYRHRVLQVFPFLSPCHSTDTESCKCSLSNYAISPRGSIVRGASWQKSLLPVTESRVPKEHSTCDVTVGGEERSAVAQFQPEI